MTTDNNTISSKDLLAQKWDYAISTFVGKTGLGFSVGIIASALFLKKRIWPIAITTGWGFGAAYADTQRIFHPSNIPGASFEKEI